MGRQVEFVGSGKRELVSPKEVKDTWQAITNKIIAQYAVASAQHETDFTTNEKDIEVSGFVSKGIFQIADDEVIEAQEWARATNNDARLGKLQSIDLYTLEGSSYVLATLAEKRLKRICEAAGLDYDDTTNLPPDVWFYVALAHNMGLGGALKTIANHGLDA